LQAVKSAMEPEFFFWDDTRRTQIKGVIFTPMMHKELVIEGQFESGDLLVSQDAGRYPLINVNDRIELTNTAGEGFEGEVRVSSIVGGVKRTILSYQPTIMESVMTGDPLTGEVRRYHIVEKERYSDRNEELLAADGYFERLQPSGTPARWITWNVNKGPAVDIPVSVKYRARFEYICMEQPEYRFQLNDDLGQLVHLRLKHKFLSGIPDLVAGPETPVTPTPPTQNPIHFS